MIRKELLSILFLLLYRTQKSHLQSDSISNHFASVTLAVFMGDIVAQMCVIERLQPSQFH